MRQHQVERREPARRWIARQPILPVRGLEHRDASHQDDLGQEQCTAARRPVEPTE
jgi:hypothetical protein